MKEWKGVQKNLTFRGFNSDTEKMSWMSMKWLNIRKNKPGVMFYKTSHATTAEVKQVDFNKKNQIPMSELNLLPLYDEPMKLSYEKFMDMQSLIPYVPPEYGELYRTLPHVQKKSAETELLPDEYEQDEN